MRRVWVLSWLLAPLLASNGQAAEPTPDVVELNVGETVQLPRLEPAHGEIKIDGKFEEAASLLQQELGVGFDMRLKASFSSGRLDGRTIGDGKRGPITEQLQTAYFDQVRGRRNSFPEWHTPVQ